MAANMQSLQPPMLAVRHKLVVMHKTAVQNRRYGRAGSGWRAAEATFCNALECVSYISL